MATIQIRDIPEDAYRVIRSRAQRQGRSLQSLMRAWVVEWAERPTAEEALAVLEQRLAASSSPGGTIETVLEALDADRSR